MVFCWHLNIGILRKLFLRKINIDIYNLYEREALVWDLSFKNIVEVILKQYFFQSF